MFLTQESLRFIRECRPNAIVMANIAQVQGSAAINEGLNTREPAKLAEPMGIKKYFIAAGGILISGWIVVKIFFGKIIGWFT